GRVREPLGRKTSTFPSSSTSYRQTPLPTVSSMVVFWTSPQTFWSVRPAAGATSTKRTGEGAGVPAAVAGRAQDPAASAARRRAPPPAARPLSGGGGNALTLAVT